MSAAPATEPASPQRSIGRRALGWLGLGALLAWTAMYHRGLGPAPRSGLIDWKSTTGFLLDYEIVWQWQGAAPAYGPIVLALPGLLLTALVFLGTRSAIARWLAVSSVTVGLIFSFWGLHAPGPWGFFHWRGSAVMLGVATAMGGALCAPLLVASWLRLHWVWRLVLYLPVFFVVVAMLRNATGTDESLFFNFSPWPVVTIFGLEIGAYIVAGLWLGLGLAVAGIPSLPRPLGFLIMAIGLLTPAVWFAGRFGADNVPPLVLLTFIAAACLLVSAWGSRVGLEKRALHLALAAALVYLPLLTGRSLSTADYHNTRFVRAQTLIDALAGFYEKEEMYPDELVELVDGGYIESIPRPRVGFDFFYDWGIFDPIEFHYQSLGSSYVLEFVFTEWVQCAYNPPWEDEYEDEEEEDEDDARFGDLPGMDDDGDEDDGDLDEVWSCPESRPELW